MHHPRHSPNFIPLMVNPLGALFAFFFKYRPAVFQQGDFTFGAPAPAVIILLVGVAVGIPAVLSYRRVRARSWWSRRAQRFINPRIKPSVNTATIGHRRQARNHMATSAETTIRENAMCGPNFRHKARKVVAEMPRRSESEIEEFVFANSIFLRARLRVMSGSTALGG